MIVKVQRKHSELGACRIRRVYENEGFSLFKKMKNKRLNNPANPIQLPMEKNVEWISYLMRCQTAEESERYILLISTIGNVSI